MTPFVSFLVTVVKMSTIYSTPELEKYAIKVDINKLPDDFIECPMDYTSEIAGIIGKSADRIVAVEQITDVVIVDSKS